MPLRDTRGRLGRGKFRIPAVSDLQRGAGVEGFYSFDLWSSGRQESSFKNSNDHSRDPTLATSYAIMMDVGWLAPSARHERGWQDGSKWTGEARSCLPTGLRQIPLHV